MDIPDDAIAETRELTFELLAIINRYSDAHGGLVELATVVSVLVNFVGRATWNLTQDIDQARDMVEFIAATAVKALPLLAEEDEPPTEH